MHTTHAGKLFSSPTFGSGNAYHNAALSPELQHLLFLQQQGSTSHSNSSGGLGAGVFGHDAELSGTASPVHDGGQPVKRAKHMPVVSSLPHALSSLSRGHSLPHPRPQSATNTTATAAATATATAGDEDDDEQHMGQHSRAGSDEDIPSPPATTTAAISGAVNAPVPQAFLPSVGSGPVSAFSPNMLMYSTAVGKLGSQGTTNAVPYMA